MKNFKSKKGHNSCKNELRVISLVCTWSPFYSGHIFRVLSTYVQQWQIYNKISQFLHTNDDDDDNNAKAIEYLRFIPKTDELKIAFSDSRGSLN